MNKNKKLSDKENIYSFVVNNVQGLNEKLKEAYEESINETENEDMKIFLNRLRKDICAGKSLFKSSKEIEEYLKESRKDRKLQY